MKNLFALLYSFLILAASLVASDASRNAGSRVLKKGKDKSSKSAKKVKKNKSPKKYSVFLKKGKDKSSKSAKKVKKNKSPKKYSVFLKKGKDKSSKSAKKVKKNKSPKKYSVSEETVQVGSVVRLYASESLMREAFDNDDYFIWHNSMMKILGTEQEVLDRPMEGYFGIKASIEDRVQPIWFYPFSVIEDVVYVPEK